MPNVILSDLVTRVRQRADMEETDFVSDTEVEGYIQESAGDLLDLMIEDCGADHFLNVTPTHSTVSGTQTYSLFTVFGEDDTLADIYKVVGVDVQIDGLWRQIRLGSNFTLAGVESEQGWAFSPERIFYRTYISTETILGDDAESVTRKVSFSPIPRAVHSFRVRYIPSPITWVGDDDDLRLQVYSGWDRYIVLDAARKCLAKEESDTSELMSEMSRIYDRIRWHAKTMDISAGGAGKVTDVDERSFMDRWRLP